MVKPRDNQRNYYRILHVQPDAPLPVIRANYRTLLQRLRMHPDLGGDHRNAALLNEAYGVLRDLRRRARYDRQLLARFDLALLASGGQNRAGRDMRTLARPAADPGRGNQRNYYRLLGVQRDAPGPVIDASYRTLLQHGSPTPRALLDEARAVLADPLSRARYDATLQRLGHHGTVDWLRRAPALLARQPWPERPRIPPRRGALVSAPFAACCPFCHRTLTAFPLPHGAGKRAWPIEWCNGCSSPLESSVPPRLPRPIGRDAGRVTSDEPVAYYRSWPGERCAARVVDLSATGVRLTGAALPAVDDIVKLDAARFQAVGAVVRRDVPDGVAVLGVRFLTVAFARPSGNFLRILV